MRKLIEFVVNSDEYPVSSDVEPETSNFQFRTPFRNVEKEAVPAARKFSSSARPFTASSVNVHVVSDLSVNVMSDMVFP